jgi:hypothetical protein
VKLYNLNKLIEDEKKEFKKFVKLLHWTHTRWFSHYDFPLPGVNHDKISQYKKKSFSAYDILKFDAPLQAIECAASSFLFIQVAASLGYSARLIFVADHVSTEIWSNEYGKWVFMDPYYDVYFTKDDIPLNWRDLHNLLKDIPTIWGGADIDSFEAVVNFYKKRNIKLHSTSFKNGYYEGPTDNGTFHFLSNHIFGPIFAVHLRNDHLENIYPPFHPRYHKYGKINMIWKQPQIDYRRINIYSQWNKSVVEYEKFPISGKYQLPIIWQYTDNIDDLYWSLNTTQLYVRIKKIEKESISLEVVFSTVTPNFYSFYCKIDDSLWEKSD